MNASSGGEASDKSPGSEFSVVMIPLLVLIGQRKALGIAVRNDRPQRRYSGLLSSLRGDGPLAVALA